MNQRRRRDKRQNHRNHNQNTRSRNVDDENDNGAESSPRDTNDELFSSKNSIDNMNISIDDDPQTINGIRQIDLENNSRQCDNSDSLLPISTCVLEAGNIMSLPDDVLYVIFRYLNQKDLCRLCMVCRRFNDLSSKDCVWLSHAERCVLVQFPFIRRICSIKEKVKVAPKWSEGKFQDCFITRHKVRQIPWMQKDGEDIWFSSGNVIRYFRCRPNASAVKEDGSRRLQGLKQDVTRFVVKKKVIVAGGSDGSVYGWKPSGESLFHHERLHQNDTHCVDVTNDCVVSGSKDGTCKIFPLHHNGSGSNSVSVQTINAGERVWCLQCSPCQRFFVAGMAGCCNQAPLTKWNLERGELMGYLDANCKYGAGVLDMKFESPNELLTCGYDTFLRLWDLRTDTCVRAWEEPYDSSLYCLQTDGANAMVVGTARHGMVRLWDKRQTQPVQFFYSTICNSPVYSLAMDYGHLYLAVDMGFGMMDFTGRTTARKTNTGQSSNAHQRRNMQRL